jgi:hypothetical protein
MSSTANINGYNLVTTPAGGSGSGNDSSFLVTGLTPNTTYTLAVSSFNLGGQSDVSNVTVTTLPNPPTALSATVLSNTSASVSFIASTGTAAINSYNLTSYPEYITASGGYSPITINGLTANTSYTFTATATNSQGTSLSSSLPSNSITTDSLPNSPSILSVVTTKVLDDGIVVPLTDVAVATPRAGVTSVGLVFITNVEPVPVCAATLVAAPTDVIGPVRLLGATVTVST